MNVHTGAIAKIAQAVIEDEIDVIAGCRLLIPHINAAGLRDDPDATVIIGVESETDDLPLGSERGNWNMDALAAKDKEREEYVSQVRSIVVAACRSLAAKLLPS
jgi:hypothetical protein